MEVFNEVEVMVDVFSIFFIFVYLVVMVVGFFIVGYFLGWIYKFNNFVIFCVSSVVFVGENVGIGVIFEKWRWWKEFLEVDWFVEFYEDFKMVCY